MSKNRTDKFRPVGDDDTLEQTEAHRFHGTVAADDEATEGHALRRGVVDDEETEGHARRM